MIKQCLIIFACLGVGELIVALTGIKFPSSIIGLIVLTFSLKMKWIRLHQIKGFSDFLSKNLAFFFVPSGVGVMLYLDIIQANWVSILGSILISTFLTIATTGWIHQIMRKKIRK